MAQTDRALSTEVASEQAKAEALFYSIGDGAISTDEFGRITRVNKIARRMLGYKKSELLGGWFPRKIVAVDADDRVVNLIDRPITRAFLTGQPVSEKTYYRRKNGQIFPVAVNVSPILVDGKPLGAVEVFRDISFEQEVDRMKSEFISLASHQLRTPLSSIKTYSHMLLDGYMGDITPAQRQSLTTIVNASNRMNALISNLLNITRLESGSIAVTYKTIKATYLVREILKELALTAETKDIELSFKLAGDGAETLRTDRLILKEILTNIIANAIKYTPEGGRVKVTIRLRADDVLFRVKDTGWGIPKYSQDQVFSKFYRAENITKRETSGTGLGLYLVKGLTEAIGGRIWFTSQEGQGSDFYVCLPRRRQRPAAKAK
ncbi:MAG TPA: ATP-binding protein [Candidatus Saccharimonadales bacterium]|nr:ATP-binding protein [Candidatus Saccharimonadales bacterium]